MAELPLRTSEAGPLVLVKERDENAVLADPGLNPGVASPGVDEVTAGAAKQTIEVCRGDGGWVVGADGLATRVALRQSALQFLRTKRDHTVFNLVSLRAVPGGGWTVDDLHAAMSSSLNKCVPQFPGQAKVK